MTSTIESAPAWQVQYDGFCKGHYFVMFGIARVLVGHMNRQGLYLAVPSGYKVEFFGADLQAAIYNADSVLQFIAVYEYSPFSGNELLIHSSRKFRPTCPMVQIILTNFVVFRD